MMRCRKVKSRAVAVCGLMCALSVAIMELGVVVPVAMYLAPMVACIIVMLVCAECGPRLAWAEYAAVAILGLFLVPDKEVAFVFAFFGYYPLVKSRFDRVRPKFISAVLKIVYFNSAVGLMYALLYSLFFPGQLLLEWKAVGLLLGGATLLVGNIAFFALDLALVRFLQLYRFRFQGRLHRLLGWH